MSSDEPSSTVAADGYAALDRYAERSLQAIDRSEIVPEMPARLVRRGIYLIAAAVVLTFALLYLGKVHVVVTANGKVVPERDAIALQARRRRRGPQHSARGLATGSRPAPRSCSWTRRNRPSTWRRSKRIHQLQQTELQSARASLAEIDRLLAGPNAAAGRPAEARPVPSAGIMALENARLALEIARQNVQRLPERRRLQAREIRADRATASPSTRRAGPRRRAFSTTRSRPWRRSSRGWRTAGPSPRKTGPPLEPSAEEERYRDAERGLLASRLRFAQQAIDVSNQKLRQSELEIKLAALAPEAASSLRQAELAYRQGLAGLAEERQALSSRIEELASGSDATAARIAQGDGRAGARDHRHAGRRNAPGAQGEQPRRADRSGHRRRSRDAGGRATRDRGDRSRTRTSASSPRASRRASRWTRIPTSSSARPVPRSSVCCPARVRTTAFVSGCGSWTTGSAAARTRPACSRV